MWVLIFVPSQWEFQIGTCDMLTVSDDLIMVRYILHRISEKYNCYGSGGHTNFSTLQMISTNGLDYIYKTCDKLKEKHNEHIKVYGIDNNKRLTGIHETSSINDFSYGVADRESSIRIPLNVYNDKSGYIEDKRPALNLDPYVVTNIIVNTILS